MGVTSAIFSLSGRIHDDKNRSKIYFSGADNSLKQRLITLALKLSIFTRTFIGFKEEKHLI